MGQSSSRRRSDDYRQTYPQHAPFPPHPPQPPPPPTTTVPIYSPYPSLTPPKYSAPYYNSPAPPATPYCYAYLPQSSSNYRELMCLLESLEHNSFPTYYRPNQRNVWFTSVSHPRPAAMPPYSFFPVASSSALPAVPPYIEHRKTKTIKNDVNLRKDMISVEVDEYNQEQYLVSFVYDAVVDGSFTIYYFAKEGANCNFSSTEEHIYKPKSYTFEQGTGKRFCQPSGHGIDFGFFDLDSLSKPLAGDIYPLVIYAKAHQPTLLDGHSAQSSSAHVQITLAVIEKSGKGVFQVKVVKQILWIDGERYELQEIYGLVESSSEPANEGDDDVGKECVICMSEQRNTAVFPCRHLCMCTDCAKSFRIKSNKCPICRQPVEKLMEINV